MGSESLFRGAANLGSGAALVLSFLGTSLTTVHAAEYVAPRPPKPLTTGEKVLASEQIFVGVATRVYFVDVNGKQLVDDPENPFYAGARVTVDIKRNLQRSSKSMPAELTVHFPTSGASGKSLREKYVGKEWIYFVRSEQIKMNVEGRTEFRDVVSFARGRRPAYPDPLEQLDAVVHEIKKIGTSSK